MNIISPFGFAIFVSIFHLNVNAVVISNVQVKQIHDSIDKIIADIMDIKKFISYDDKSIGVYLNPAKDIVRSLRNHQLSEAKELLVKMADIDRIPATVHEMYDNSFASIDLLLDFAEALKESNFSQLVLYALQYEMHANRRRDPYKLIQLAKALEREGPEMQDIANETIDDIIDVMTEIYKTALYSGNENPEQAVQIEALARAVDNYKPDLSDRTMKRLINETYGYSTVSPGIIADNVYKLRYIPQVAIGLVELFWQLENNRDLNNEAVFKIADYIRQLKRVASYDNLSTQRRQSVEQVIDKLPNCVKHLNFASSICLWNRGQDEPLYAAIGTYGRSISGESIFTWIPKGDPGPQGYWYPERVAANRFYLRNKHFPKHYLHASLSDYDTNNRYVHAWLNSKWQFELNGESCYIKNVEHDIYMYVSQEKYDPERRHVFTHAGKLIKGLDFEWYMHECR